MVAAEAQVPANIESELVKMGHIVDPPCTAKLYRPLMPANDITSGATPVYPGITVVRDASFGPNPKDVVDIFTADKGPASRPVLIYVPGGGGNKIELQDKEANAFYDNIGRWATKNGMVFVNMQRHGGPGWDAGAKDISAMITVPRRLPPGPITTFKSVWQNTRDYWYNTRVTELAESEAGDQIRVSRQMLPRDSHIRMEAKRQAA
jgi:hypothetical protein